MIMDTAAFEIPWRANSAQVQAIMKKKSYTLSHNLPDTDKNTVMFFSGILADHLVDIQCSFYKDQLESVCVLFMNDTAGLKMEELCEYLRGKYGVPDWENDKDGLSLSWTFYTSGNYSVRINYISSNNMLVYTDNEIEDKSLEYKMEMHEKKENPFKDL